MFDQISDPYADFISRLKLLVEKRPDLITTTLSNIFTMRLIGNKTHGDLAEIAIAEFINQYMYDFRSVHVGKDLYRAKSNEDDVKVINEMTKAEFPVSLKAYGDGPLQLSTDKNFRMFPRLEQEGKIIVGEKVREVLNDTAFANFRSINVLPLIYNEDKKQCNILVFDYRKAEQETRRIVRIEGTGRRIHPVYRFYDKHGRYICEVRYGSATANALQRGLWSHTRNGLPFFESVTNGWVNYSHNKILVQLFSHALVSSQQGHDSALERIKKDINLQKNIGRRGRLNVNETKLLFRDAIRYAPETEGIKYAGSKLKMLPHILSLVEQTGADSVFDGFSGSTRVTQALAKQGRRVHSNDVAVWSSVFATAYLKNEKQPHEYVPLIRYLNSLEPIHGWFTSHYGGIVTANPKGNAIQPDGSKRPWQMKNTRKMDAIRDEIDKLELDEVARCVALTSLILAMDRVENTLGHYSSYLKDWSPRSFNNVRLEVPMLGVNEKGNDITCSDVFDIVPNVNCDLAYYDPPYGSNNKKMPASRVRYAAYYHIWTTLIKNDRPALFGRAARRMDSSDKNASSVFEEFRRNGSGRFIVVEAIEKLIRETPCEWIVLSYSSGGRATAHELNQVINDTGKLIQTRTLAHQRNVMASMKWTNEWTREIEVPNREFLFLIQKK